MEGSLLARFEHSLAQESKQDLRNKRFRQEVGLLLSEFWPRRVQPSNPDSSVVGLVARHLKQPPSVPQQTSSKEDGGVPSPIRPRHPGYIEIELLCQSQSVKGNDPALATQNPATSSPLFFPTCPTCFAPLQPAAFGCSTRVTSTSTGSTRRSKLSASQKRRKRRKRHKQSTQPRNNPKLEFAKWYEQTQNLNQSRSNAASTALEVTCGKCQETTSIPIQKPMAQAPAPPKTQSKEGENQKLSGKDKKPSYVTKSLQKDELSKQPSSTLLSGTKRSHKESAASADLEGDFIPLSSSEPSQKKSTTNDNNMRSAVKPKKKKKKNRGSRNTLQDFLSSLNDP